MGGEVMIEQVKTTDFMRDLSESHKKTLHPFVGQTITKLCERLQIINPVWRIGSVSEDKEGADIVLCGTHNGKYKELKIDLKITDKPSYKRIPVEWQRGLGQIATPWAISGKSSIILWINTALKRASFVSGTNLARELTASPHGNLTRNMLTTGFDYRGKSVCNGQTFETKCRIVNKDVFDHWAKALGIGGGL